MLEINSTIIVQIVNFLLLLFVLNLILYRPIRGVLNRRREEMEGLKSAAEDLLGKAGEREKDIEEGMAEARRAGHKEKDACKAEGMDEQTTILREAGDSAARKIAEARTETDGKVAEVRKALESQIAAFSEELAEKILGRSIS